MIQLHKISNFMFYFCGKENASKSGFMVEAIIARIVFYYYINIISLSAQPADGCIEIISFGDHRIISTFN